MRLQDAGQEEIIFYGCVIDLGKGSCVHLVKKWIGHNLFPFCESPSSPLTVFRLLECLVRQAGLIVTPRHIIREVWGPDRVDDPRSLRVLVKTLRKKLEPDPHRPRHLVTEAGLGYRLRLEEPATGSSPPSEER